MKFLLGALSLLAATSTWANGCATDPSYGYGCGGGYGDYGTGPEIIAPPPTGGTSVRIITGHDGRQSIESGPSFSGSDEIRLIDYSGDYITEDWAPLDGYNGPMRFPD